MKQLFAMLSFALMAGCVSTPQEIQGWPALTRVDVEAAYRILDEDHPGASLEAGDAAFRATLEEARRVALNRADEVRSFEGYNATLAGFVNAIGDRHVGALPLYRSDTRNWAGLITTMQGGQFVVMSGAQPEESSLVGARVASCDNVPIETFAREKLGGFRAVWSIEAQRLQAAPFLLIDDGNPFVLRPRSCVFELNGVTRDVVLQWRPIQRSELSPMTRRALNQGQAGYGVRDFAGGVWIALEGLEDPAEAVAEAVRRDGERLRRARNVVLDLRGNHGGNDIYGRYIAEVLFGAERVAAVLGNLESNDTDCASPWRASARNEARLRELRATITDAATLRIIDDALSGIERARLQGRDFGGPTTCPARQPADANPPPPQAATGRIVVLTDNVCFSSCLSVTDQFRRLGALHAGQTTNANTHYSEVRVDTLPSGLSIFSTLQAIMSAAPLQFGPFEPSLRYDGDMADTAALEAWIGATVPVR